jgi:hypothetical protein
MDNEDSSSNEDGGRMRRGGPVAIDDDDSEVSDGAEINESAQTASQHRSQPARETVSRKVVQQLKDQVVSLKAQLYDVGKRESQWQSETKNVKNKYRQKIAQLQSRVVELESGQARNSSSDANAATHEAAVSTENQQLEQLLQLERRESQVSREKTAELQTELQHMSSQNKAVSQKYTSLTNQLNNVKAHLKEARAETDKLKGELESAHAQAADAAQRSTSPPPQRVDKQQASGAPGSPAQAQAQEELTRRYAKVQKQLELREERLEELEAELQAAHAATTLRERHVKELELKVSDAEFQTEAQVRGLSVHTEELNESLRDAEERVRNLADINMKKGYDIADLQNAVRGWEERCARQSAELRDLRASDAHLDQRVRDLAARARAGEEDCRRLQDKLTERDGHISALQRDIDRKSSRAINDVRRAATIPAEAGNPASGAGPSQEAYAQLLAVKEKVSKGFQPLPGRLLTAKQAVAGSSSQQDPLSLPSLKNLLDTVEATAAAVNGAIRGGFPGAGLLRSLCGVTDAGGNPQMQAFALVAGYYVYHANHAAAEAAEKDQAIDAIMAEVAAIPIAQQHATSTTLGDARSEAGAGGQDSTGAQSPDDGTACSETSLGSGDDLQPPAKQPRLQLELPQAVQDTARDPRIVKLRASPPTAPAADAGTDAALFKPVAVLGAAAADSPAAVVSPLATLGKRAYSSVAEGSGEGPYTSVCITGEISPGRAESLANRVGPVYVFRTLSAHRFLVVYTSAELARRAVSALNGHVHKGRTMISCQPHWEVELTSQLSVEPRMVVVRYPVMSQAAVMTALCRYGRVLSMYSVGEEYMALFADATAARTAADSLNCTMLAGKLLICKHLPSLPPVDRAKWTEYFAQVCGQPAGTDDDGPSEEPSPKRPDNREVTMPPSAQQTASDDLDLLWQRRHAMCSIQATVTLYVMIRHQTLSRDALCAELSKFGTVVFMTQAEDRYLAGFNNAEAAVGASRGLSNTFTEGKVITCRHFPKLPLVEKVKLLPGYTELELSRAFEGPTGLCVEKVEYCEILADLMREPVLRISPSMFTAAQQYVSYIDSVLADNSRSRTTTSEPKQLSSPKSSWRDASPPRTSAVRTTTAPQTFTCTLPPCSTAASSGGGKSNTTVAKAAKRYCTICAERGLGKEKFTHDTEYHREMLCTVCRDMGLGGAAFTHSTENHRHKNNAGRPRGGN